MKKSVRSIIQGTISDFPVDTEQNYENAQSIGTASRPKFEPGPS